MKHSLKPIGCLVTLLVVAPSCGGGLRSTAAIGGGDWSPVKEGKAIVLYSDPSDGKACATKFGKTREELKSGGGASLSDAPWSKSASAWTVKSSLVDDHGETQPNLYLELERAGSSERIWVYSAASTQPDCLHPGQDGLAQASLALGKSFSWAPWRETCTEIVAGGPSFKPLLEKVPDATAFTADSIVLTDRGAVVKLGGGSLLTTPATLANCFAEVGTEAAKSPASGALALLRISPERCDTDRQNGFVHVACRSTVGAWNGDDSGIHGVRRTLGPIHFLEGKPVSGRRFARAVVAIDTGKAENGRETELYNSIRTAATELINHGDDSVRIAPVGDPTVTSNVKISVHDVSIGELRTTRSQQTAKYVVRTDTVPNTAKSEARSQLEQAEQLLSSKRNECSSMPSSDFSASQACVDRCVANSAGSSAALCGFTCKDAGGDSGAKQDCENRVQQAESALQSARQAYDSMPDTLTNTVYGEFPYERIDYARKVSAVIQTDSGSSISQKHATDPLEFEAADYQVVGDAAHNVEGHTARRDFIDSPDSILPNLAERASGIAIKRLREALSQGAIDAALRAMAAAGGSAKPGFESVDAMAFDVVGKRLIKAERYGDAVGPLPTSEIAVAAGECLLAVAVSADATSEVALRSKDGHFADQRKRPFAALELCAGEWSGPKPPETLMDAKQAHWAIYRTHEKNADLSQK